MEGNQENNQQPNFEELFENEENLNKAINIIKGKSFVVKPTKDYNELENTLRKEIGSHFGGKLSAIDQTLMDLGFEKGSNEPTEEFTTRAAKELKGQLDAIKAQRDEGVTGADGLKAENESLAGKVKNLTKQLEDQVKSFESEKVNMSKTQKVKEVLSKLQFKEGLDTVITPALNQFIEETLNSTTLEEGALIYKDDTGVTLRNEKGEPLTVEAKALEAFESVLHSTNKKQGVGGDNKNKQVSSLTAFANSRDVKTFADMEAAVTSFYAQQNKPIVKGGREYREGMKELKEYYKK
jgi:flagellar motility protein MotE (MotC chaperone)